MAQQHWGGANHRRNLRGLRNEPDAPKQTVAATEMVIQSGTGVQYEQGEQKPRAVGVRYTGRILPEIRNQHALSAKD